MNNPGISFAGYPVGKREIIGPVIDRKIERTGRVEMSDTNSHRFSIQF
jgi:hypothetical protein